ncbi:aromatic ring-hydroxylating oxygenase subunit alpha [Streptomyces griseoflavus]|uniref:aromatic ring-hydroxylating oxygenase subunit alpha n=1 Tax=Streptomyces griseoflavus TaxID=35619 RepID=UPI0033E6C6BE
MREPPIRGPQLPADALDRILTARPEAAGLPAEAYTSAEVHAFEQELLQRRGWVCLGRTDQVAERGAQRALTVAGEGVLVVRDTETVGVFVNACRHRGHELVRSGCAVRRATVWCAYHAWVYRLDGTLRAAPRFGDLAERDPVGMGLTPVRSEEWHGFLFVNLSGDAPSLAATAGNLGPLLEAYEPAGLIRTAEHEYEVSANWKLLVENYLECYHCPSTHPELSKVQRTTHGLDFEDRGLWLGGYLDLDNDAVSMSLDGRGPDWRFPGLDEERARQVCYHALLPGLFITAMHDYLVVHRIQPLAADRTRVVCEVLFPRALLDLGTDPGYAAEFWDVTNRQDWQACESVQRGITRPGFTPGPLAPEEEGLGRFLATMAFLYRSGRSPSAPWPTPAAYPGALRTAATAGTTAGRQAR